MKSIKTIIVLSGLLISINIGVLANDSYSCNSEKEAVFDYYCGEDDTCNKTDLEYEKTINIDNIDSYKYFVSDYKIKNFEAEEIINQKEISYESCEEKDNIKEYNGEEIINQKEISYESCEEKESGTGIIKNQITKEIGDIKNDYLKLPDENETSCEQIKGNTFLDDKEVIVEDICKSESCDNVGDYSYNALYDGSIYKKETYIDNFKITEKIGEIKNDNIKIYKNNYQTEPYCKKIQGEKFLENKEVTIEDVCEDNSCSNILEYKEYNALFDGDIHRLKINDITQLDHKIKMTLQDMYINEHNVTAGDTTNISAVVKYENFICKNFSHSSLYEHDLTYTFSLKNEKGDLEFVDKIDEDNEQYDFLGNGDDFLKIRITEPFKLTHTPSYNVYFAITDNEGNINENPNKLRDTIGVDPNHINKNKSEFDIIGKDKTEHYNQGYYKGDNIRYKFKFVDEYGNIVRNSNISITHRNSTINNLLNYKYDNGGQNMRYIGNGEYELNFTADSSLVLPEDFIISHNGNNKTFSKSSVYIKTAAGNNDFNISCTNSPIELSVTCTYDNKSGCAREDPPKKFYSESDNGSSGKLSFYDKAQNQTSLAYEINHIDKTSPKIDNTKINGVSVKDGVNLKSSDEIDFFASLNDYFPSECGAKVDYNISIKKNNGTNIFSKNGTTYNQEIDFEKELNDFENAGQDLKIKISLTDKAGNNKNYTYDNIHTYPADISASNTELNLNTPSQRNDNYATATSKYQYKLILKDEFGNRINSKKIKNISYAGDQPIVTNMVEENGNKAVTVSPSQATTNSNGIITFSLKSIVPVSFKEKLKLNVPEWDNNYNTTNRKDITIEKNQNEFKKPYTGELTGDVSINTTKTLQLNVKKKAGISLPSYTINNFVDAGSLKMTKPSYHLIQNQTGFTNKNSDPNFDIRINAKNNEGINKKPGLKLSPHPTITYTYGGGKTIKYNLTAKEGGSDNTVIKKGGKSGIKGAKIVGVSQSDGKQSVTNNMHNISDISKFQISSEINKKANQLIRGMSSGEINNGIKYVNGTDIKLSGELNYETLIVKKGNVIIEGDLNENEDKLGIICLNNDWSPTDNKGNIFINSDVSFINSLIYADGGIISSDNSGNPLLQDTAHRTNTLNKQLIIKGMLITNNTLGGAFKGNQDYILPTKEKTSDFDKAMIYDLNYLRRGNQSCEGNPGCKKYFSKYDHPTVIIYDPKMKLDPPVGFK